MVVYILIVHLCSSEYCSVGWADINYFSSYKVVGYAYNNTEKSLYYQGSSLIYRSGVNCERDRWYTTPKHHYKLVHGTGTIQAVILASFSGSSPAHCRTPSFCRTLYGVWQYANQVMQNDRVKLTNVLCCTCSCNSESHHILSNHWHTVIARGEPAIQMIGGWLKGVATPPSYTHRSIHTFRVHWGSSLRLDVNLVLCDVLTWIWACPPWIYWVLQEVMRSIIVIQYYALPIPHPSSYALPHTWQGYIVPSIM